jgi:hypothetical protein
MTSNSFTRARTESPQDADDVVREYFHVAPQQDIARYLALFAADAMTEDEGHVYHGIDQIREWRAEVIPVAYDVRDIRRIDPDLQALVEISGDFPGSPVTLRFLFQISGDGLITRLAIRS